MTALVALVVGLVMVGFVLHLFGVPVPRWLRGVWR
mgnify:CR=1 FL=1